MPVHRDDDFPGLVAVVAAAAGDAVEEAAKDELNHMKRNWDDGKDALGRPWQELSPETIRNKGHGKILIDSGDMYESAGSRRTGPFSAIVEVTDPKISIHEYGTATIPRRPVLGPSLTHAEENVRSELVRRITASVTAFSAARRLF